MWRDWPVVCPAISALLFTLSLASAGIPEISWEANEFVDEPVFSVSSSAGVSVLNVDGVWHVVYEKSGDIYHRSRTQTGWEPLECLSSDIATSRSPHLAYDDRYLHVVWEDESSGHPEVRTRRRDGETWSPEECLSCDSTVSRAPVVAGDAPFAIVAWEEVGPGGACGIKARLFNEGSWGESEWVSTNMTSAASPSVTANPYGYAFTVVWSDGRFGSAEIFGRMWIPYFKEWHDEMRLTNRSTSCLRPSVHAEFCCGDLGYPMAMVVFEGDTLAVPEVYGLVFTDGGPEAMAPISVIDGQPSVLPNIHGFWFSSDGPFGGGTRKYFVTWTDQILTTKINRHCLALLVEEPYAPEDTLIFSQTGMPGSAVRGIEGFPDAEVMILWVEPVGPSAVLLSRRGTLPGKTSVEDPEPATAVRVAAVTPNPAESIVTIRIGTDGVAELTVCVVDVTGRMVRNLDRFEISSYRTTVIWDTRDDAGREVAPGAYFVRVEWDGRHDDKAIHVIR